MSSRTGLTGVEMADGTVLMYPCSNRRRGAASGPATGLGKMTSGMAPSLVRSTSRVFEEAMFRQLIAAPPPKWRKASLDEADQQTSNVRAWQRHVPAMQAYRHRVGGSR